MIKENEDKAKTKDDIPEDIRLLREDEKRLPNWMRRTEKQIEESKYGVYSSNDPCGAYRH